MRNSRTKKIALLGVMAILIYAAIIIAVIGGTGGFDRETAPSSTPIVIPTISPTPTPSPTPTNEPGVVYVTGEKLCDDYNSNQVDADIKYKGRILEVSSTVDGVGRDVLYGGKAFLRMNCGLITDVWCYFDKAYESQLVSVYEGDSVSVRGICTGKNLLSKRIVLHPCTSVKFLISE
jgi:hypothetical protein